MSKSISELGYNPDALPRELCQHYITASEEDIKSMQSTVGVEKLEDLFNHIPKDVRLESLDLPEELSYEELQSAMEALAQQNHVQSSFMGDGLQVYQVPDIVPFVCGIRNLTTAYTPYQPERSQGSLITHWIYQCALSMLTGFEAINASLYDRATAIFEAICCAIRMGRGTSAVLVSEGVHPGDIEVLNTLVASRDIDIHYIPLNESGYTDLKTFEAAIEKYGKSLAGIVFPQVNQLGILEDVDLLTDTAAKHALQAIAVVDPMLLATGGLKAPADYGASGADIIVGEAQHLAIGANFGGPGLGIFGVRHNEKTKNAIRSTPGRFIGKAKDLSGRDCYVIVLSTREQHIRKDKATSNICSNQAFLATAAGAAILARGESGMQAACRKGYDASQSTLPKLLKCKEVRLAYPKAAAFNEYTLEVPISTAELIKKGQAAGLHIGVDMTGRLPSRSGHFIKISFSDTQTGEDCQKLISFFESTFGPGEDAPELPQISESHWRQTAVGLPDLEEKAIRAYYEELGDQNVSPDDSPYPLGSCTMKYNPYINDWAASLPGFTHLHPQAPLEDAQGSLAVLYEIQEWFKAITDLPAVTTEPVAGAQGELVGIKLFQAYHEHQGGEKRDIIFIPKSAHGTNFATATAAGFDSKSIITLEASSCGQIDMDDFRAKLEEYGPRLCGVMVTNPNTSGVFETSFKEMADAVHQAGGLVYMDGANMNAIAGWVSLGKLGVDAVHNNLHKTWTIPHGGGGPGDAIVAVSEKLADFLPGYQIEKDAGTYRAIKPKHSIGAFHRHWGNFAHKVRCLTYLKRLGKAGVPRMSAVAVLAARYIFERLKPHFPTLPAGASDIPRMHEFILTLSQDSFAALEKAGIPKSNIIPRVGKLFLDFGFHAPTVAFPETFGLMIEPTESYTPAELDRFCDAVIAMKAIIEEAPSILETVPHVTPIDRVDEVSANRQLIVSEPLKALPELHPNRIHPTELGTKTIAEIQASITGSLTSV